MPELQVEGMTCSHCVRAVTEAVNAVPGVSAVSVDLAAGRVTVEGTAAPEAVRAAITQEGYTVR